MRRRRAVRGSGRAITIVELIVALAISSIVMGLLFEIYIQTLGASLKLTQRHAAIDHALRVSDEVRSLLTDAIAPADLEDPSIVETVFEADRLRVPAYRADTAQGLYAIEIRRIEDDDAKHGAFEANVSPVAGAAGDGGAEAESRNIGGRPRELATELSFRYALEVQPDRPIEYLDSLSSGQWPKLIEVTLKVTPDRFDDEVVEFHTAFIPGRRSFEIVEAPPVQQSAPAAESAPAAVESSDPAPEAQEQETPAPATEQQPPAAEPEAELESPAEEPPQAPTEPQTETPAEPTDQSAAAPGQRDSRPDREVAQAAAAGVIRAIPGTKQSVPNAERAFFWAELVETDSTFVNAPIELESVPYEDGSFEPQTPGSSEGGQ